MLEEMAENDTPNDWELDKNELKFGTKVSSGDFAVLYRGTYSGQDVVVKMLKRDHFNETLHREFLQEILMMRKLSHRNVVQFVGACTEPPDVSIVTEFMSGGSVYDFLHRHHRTHLKLPTILRMALDISEGMNYLHQNNIIHRDLKPANLLLDENEVVKVADFGLARVPDQMGVMTSETGTYRWMAPEVIAHQKYDNKVDVFSFGVVLWELLTGRLPYADVAPFQAAIGVAGKGLRPTIPKRTNPKIANLLERCWANDPALRPEFAEIIVTLQEILNEGEEEEDEGKGGTTKEVLSALKPWNR